MKLQNLSEQSAGKPQAAALNTRISELKRAFREIQVEGKFGTCTLPLGAYPTIRYARLQGDWSSTCTKDRSFSELNDIAKNTIVTLRALGNII